VNVEDSLAKKVVYMQDVFESSGIERKYGNEKEVPSWI